jgi:hypothetical protein
MSHVAAQIPKNIRAWILSFLTIGLLCLYVWAALTMIHTAWACNQPNPTLTSDQCVVSQRLATLTTTLQGLVSAVVITVLAISPANGSINLVPFGVASKDGDQPLAATILALAYVGCWFLVGASALGIGTIVLSDPNAMRFSTLVNVGAAWLGLAIGAVYAYFGINRTK